MADQIQIVPQPTPQKVTSTSDPLLKVTTVWPFDFFPNDVVVDRYKVDVVKRDFFASERVITIPLSGTVTVNINKSLFFSAAEIADTAIGTKTTVKFLSNEDAARLRQMILGLVVGIRQGINFMGMPSNEVIDAAMNWGTIDTSTPANVPPAPKPTQTA